MVEITKINQIDELHEIKNALSGVKNEKELLESSINILAKMERLYGNQVRQNNEYYGKEVTDYITFDNTLNLKNPVTIFEKNGKKLLDIAKKIEKKAKDSSNLFDFIKYLHEDKSGKLTFKEMKNKYATFLLNVYQKADKTFEKDMNDNYILENPYNISYGGTASMYRSKGDEIYHTKLQNEKEYFEKIKGISDKEILKTVLNIRKGFSAFEEGYKEIKKRIGNTNIFDFINITFKDNLHEKKAVTLSCISCLLSRNKEEDFKKYYNGCKNKKYIQTIMENNSTSSEYLKKGILKSLDFLKTKMKNLDIEKIFANSKDNTFKDCFKAIDMSSMWENIDVFKTKKVNGLMIYDNEGHGGGSEYFALDKGNYIKNGFTVIEEKNNTEEGTYVVKLKKGSDIITMIQIDGYNYKEILTKNKIIKGGGAYNLFALRGHCGSTTGMAVALGETKMAKKGTILLDGGCRNAEHIQEYVEMGVESLMFAYNDEGRGASTQFLINKIIENKNKSFTEYIENINSYKEKNDTYGKYAAIATEKPDSIFYYYSVKKAKANMIKNMAINTLEQSSLSLEQASL